MSEEKDSGHNWGINVNPNSDEVTNNIYKNNIGMVRNIMNEKDEQIKELRTRVAEQDKEILKERKRGMEITEHLTSGYKKLKDEEIQHLKQKITKAENATNYYERMCVEKGKEAEDLSKKYTQATDEVIRLEREQDELKNRLSQAEKKFNDANELCGQKHDKMREFQDRLSTLEAENSRLRHGCGDDVSQCAFFVQLQMDTEKIQSLESKLSTLLKASEGLEKALEVFTEYDDIESDRTEALKALADFRAVKEK